MDKLRKSHPAWRNLSALAVTAALIGLFPSAALAQTVLQSGEPLDDRPLNGSTRIDFSRTERNRVAQEFTLEAQSNENILIQVRPGVSNLNVRVTVFDPRGNLVQLYDRGNSPPLDQVDSQSAGGPEEAWFTTSRSGTYRIIVDDVAANSSNEAPVAGTFDISASRFDPVSRNLIRSTPTATSTPSTSTSTASTSTPARSTSSASGAAGTPVALQSGEPLDTRPLNGSTRMNLSATERNRVATEFSFQAQSNEDVVIDIVPEVSNLDVRMTVFDPRGNVVAQENIPGGGAPERAVFTTNRSGVYSIIVDDVAVNDLGVAPIAGTFEIRAARIDRNTGALIRSTPTAAPAPTPTAAPAPTPAAAPAQTPAPAATTPAATPTSSTSVAAASGAISYSFSCTNASNGTNLIVTSTQGNVTKSGVLAFVPGRGSSSFCNNARSWFERTFTSANASTIQVTTSSSGRNRTFCPASGPGSCSGRGLQFDNSLLGEIANVAGTMTFADVVNRVAR